MLQTYIPYSSKNTTLINEKIAMDSDDEQVVFLQQPGRFTLSEKMINLPKDWPRALLFP
jgi:hypothetical protein